MGLVLACAPHREPTPAAGTQEVVAVTPAEPATIEVRAEWPGSSAAEVERSLVIPLERALQGVPNVTRIASSAGADRATLVLTLDARADPGRTRKIVYDALARARKTLPEDVFPVIGSDLAAPASALVFALTSTTADSMQMHRIAEDLRQALGRLPGVDAVETCGGREPRLVVALDPARMSALRVTASTVVEAVKTGLRDDRGVNLGGLSVVGTRSMDELMALVVVPGRQPVLLRDLASITLEPAIRDCEARRSDGALAVIGRVHAWRGADLEALHATLRAELAVRRRGLPPGVELAVFAAPPLRFALGLEVAQDLAGTVAHASETIGAALAAGRVARLAFVQATASSPMAMGLDGELLLASEGIDAAAIITLESRLDSLVGVHLRGLQGDPSQLGFRILGDELDTARQIARAAAEAAAKWPGVLRAEAQEGEGLELVLDLRREALARLGLTASDVMLMLAAALDGAPAGQSRWRARACR